MKAIPLIQKADVQSINTSIIALKEAQKELETLNIQVNRKISDLNKLLDGLDVNEIGGSGKLIQSIKQTDGKISATSVDLTSTIASGNNQPATSGGVADAINNLPVDRYKVLSTNAESVLFYIGSTWNAQSYQAFTNIYMRGGRVDGRYGEAFLSLVHNNLVDGKLLTPMDNIQIYVTQENNELKLYALLASYSFLILEVAPYSKFNIDIQVVGQTSGTVIFHNSWASIVTNLNDLGLGNLKAITYPATRTGRQMFYDMVDDGIFIDRDGFKIT